MDDKPMTVAFVTYMFQDQIRRVGPMPREPAESFAKEVARRPNVSSVRLEKWMCVDSVDYPSGGPA